MIKVEIIRNVSEKTKQDRKMVHHVIEAFMDSIKSSLMQGEPVFLREFGTFGIKLRKEKIGRLMSRDKPCTPVVIPAHYIAFFKPSTELKDEVKLIKVKE